MVENTVAAFNLPSEYDTERSRIQRAMRMAAALQAQSMAEPERFSYQGIQAHPSWAGGVGRLIQGLTGSYMQSKADEELKALGARYRGDERADREALIRALEPAPGTPGQPAYTPTGADFVDNPNLQVGPGGDVPAILPTAARPFGRIDADLMAQMKTPGGQQMVMGQILAQRQAAIEAARKVQEAFTLGEGQVRFGVRPDGSYGPIAEGGVKQRAGDLGVYDEYAAQVKTAGGVPKSIEQFITDLKIAGRTPAAETYGTPLAAVDDEGNQVFIQPGRGGGPPSIMPGYRPPDVKLKQIPPSVNMAILDNEKSLSQLDRALALTSGAGAGGYKPDPAATGWKGYLPPDILNRADPRGVAARAEIGDIGSMIIHDRSGAAVTASETPRLKPFIPLITDDAATLKLKLNRLKAEVEATQRGIREMYSEEQGYRPPPAPPQAGLGAAKDSAPSPAVPAGSPKPFTNEQAAEWLAKNPNDPKAAAVRKKLGL